MLLLGLAAASLPIGYLADRLRRPRLLAMGFAVWSLATVATGLARSYDQIQVARALVGVGGATFEVVALTILMDLFPRAVRARVLAVFFLAVPMGAALGLSVAGAFARVTTWQTAFLAVGAPGLLLALVSLVLPDPVRGSSEGVDIQRLRLARACRPKPRRLHRFDGQFVLYIFGLRHHVFVVCARRAGLLVADLPDGGQGVDGGPGRVRWVVSFLGAAILGTAAGAWLADRFATVKPRALFVLPGLGMIAAIAFTLAAIYGRSTPWIFGGLFLAEGAMFMNIVPCYTIIASVVMPNMRAVACGAALASIHLLGDIWSPTLMGWAVDTFGQADSMATIFGRALTALDAVPVAQPGRDPENLTAGMLVVIPALLISGVVLLSGLAPSATRDGAHAGQTESDPEPADTRQPWHRLASMRALNACPSDEAGALSNQSGPIRL